MAKKQVKKKDYWSCSRCEINSETNGRMCPCPRGSCEAEIIGAIVTTKEIILKTKKELKSEKAEADKKLKKFNNKNKGKTGELYDMSSFLDA